MTGIAVHTRRQHRHSWPATRRALPLAIPPSRAPPGMAGLQLWTGMHSCANQIAATIDELEASSRPHIDPRQARDRVRKWERRFAGDAPANSRTTGAESGCRLEHVQTAEPLEESEFPFTSE